MKVIFLQEFNLDCTRKFKLGEPAELAESTARYLAKYGKVQIVDEQHEKPRYKRKDLRAES